jgi:hypothetical protein
MGGAVEPWKDGDVSQAGPKRSKQGPALALRTGAAESPAAGGPHVTDRRQFDRPADLSERQSAPTARRIHPDSE